MGEVLVVGRAPYAAFVAITPAGIGAGLHPQAQPEGRSEAEDGAARLMLFFVRTATSVVIPRKSCAVVITRKCRAAVAGAAPIPARSPSRRPPRGAIPAGLQP